MKNNENEIVDENTNLLDKRPGKGMLINLQVWGQSKGVSIEQIKRWSLK